MRKTIEVKRLMNKEYGSFAARSVSRSDRPEALKAPLGEIAQRCAHWSCREPATHRRHRAKVGTLYYVCAEHFRSVRQQDKYIKI